ncbi:MAG: RNA-binding transcriptional accessory protein [Anaerolineae bacterium]|jgi:protein Tex|nr:RNA-binding transcriptional accessory protein [Anaerolineae bacterium]MBT7070352.1 RNA-binding transcriptional accessory protein [Anaerolineae bacterium]MBT7324394.1 RNA-binding transcriptional accessory protein [Anaerolineae bacterium]
MSHIIRIATLINAKPAQVEATIRLLDEGNTVPFISRYRKEMTGSLDDEQVRIVADEILRLRALDDRRATVLKSIEEQGKLTDKLRVALLAADTLTALEDLYAPYRPKRRTRATMAREKGLEPLAELILTQSLSGSPKEAAAEFLGDDVPDVEEALQGARDIIAESISDNANVRAETREKSLKFATLRAEKIKAAQDERGVYESYYAFEGRVDRLQPHQVLALSRGEKAGILKVRVKITERDWLEAVQREFSEDMLSPFADQLEEAMQDAASRLLLPAIERDVRRALAEKSDSHAIQVFATNLRALLGQAPLIGQTVLAIDPGFRTGSKVAVVDATSKLLDTGTIYPHPPQKKWGEALSLLEEMINRHHVTLVAVGNGTASRETEQLVAELTRNAPATKYLIVNEAGASVYSASPLARAEFPDLDVSIRGAVSIARRAQDPLAELVKIDPKSIGVGMYQHDVNQKDLGHALDGVVESVVNQVGVDVNTASSALLTHVAGVGTKLAERIVAQRDTEGVFKTRKSLLKVSGLGAKAYEQSAGFLRIRDGANPLDASAIHPESYPIAEAILGRAGISPASVIEERIAALEALAAKISPEELSKELGCGLPTLNDILEQLVRPGRDPRSDAPAPILRSDVLKMSDLIEGMSLKGTVRNVVDFGAFVDIGVKQDGLLHKSKIPFGTTLKVGDILDIEILKIEAERGRIGLGWSK